MKNRWIVAACAAVCWTASAQTTAPYAPAPENLQARTAFQDAKFGIFLHWGLYSMLGSGEWTMTNRDINYREYAKLANAFYPHDFDAAEWVSAIKSSGAGYVCFTTRHHDGFSMWDTAQTDYDIVDATPYKQDIVKALSDECARQDIRLHLYYSLIDWYRDDCPRGRTGLGTGRPGTAISYERYYDFMKRQLTELLTGYGPVGAIWFDGVWDQDRNPDFDWKLRGLFPEYVQAREEYHALAQELEETMGRQWYFTFEDRLNQYWAWENQAYYLFGLNLRREILEGFQGEG